MKLLNISSSFINGVGYKPDEKTMHIRFSKGATYAYYNVPESVYHELTNTKSGGAYFNSAVKNRYDYTKIA